MVRISDILKNKPDEEGLPKKNPPKQEAVKGNISNKPAAPVAETPSFQTSPVMSQKEAQCNVEPLKVYKEAIEFLKTIFEKGKEGLPIEGRTITEFIAKFIEYLRCAEDEFIRLVHTFDEDEVYILSHSVNTSILAAMLGAGMSYARDSLIELASCAFLADIGMIKVESVAKQHKKLDPEEFEQIKKHIFYGIEILETIRDLNNVVIYVASQIHERMDGTGYPNGLSDGQIDEYARIIAVVDAYDALIHSRPYRKAFLPYEAMQEILKDKESFDHTFLKALIERIGVYPIGSLVELNTGETGKVIKSNRALPLRPVLEILFDTNGNPLKQPKAADLVNCPTLYIRKALKEEDLKKT